MRGFRFGLRFILLSFLAFLLLLFWLLLGVISTKGAEKALADQKRQHARLMLQWVAEGMKGPDVSHPDRALLETLRQDPDFVSVSVRTPQGTLLWSYPDAQTDDPKEGAVSVTRPLQRGAEPSIARLTLSQAREKQHLARLESLFLAYFVLDFFLLLGLGSLLLQRLVLNPVETLRRGTEKLAAGDLDHRVPVVGSSEIAEVAESFNAMGRALRERTRDVERYVATLEQTNRELLESRAETLRAEKLASVGLVAAGMAHEIGTPLASIIGFAGILKDELKGDPEKTDYAIRIAADAARIDRIIRGLLDFARPKRSHLGPLDLVRLVRETIDLLGEQGALKKLRTTVRHDDLPVVVQGDRDLVQQVLVNIVLNARDAMPEGGDLVISVERLGEKGVVEVLDDGPGIPAALLGRIFDPFFTTKEPGKGTGLGLAISARISDALGGSLDAGNRDGGGAFFRFSLPLSPRKGEGKTDAT